MRKSFILLLISVILTNIGRAQDFGFRFKADSYFFNAEFAHPLKPGYTLPGYTIHPLLTFSLDGLQEKQLVLSAGYYLGRMHGLQKAWVKRPTFSIKALLINRLYCTLGTLDFTNELPLPEAIYTRQYQWLNAPEAGAAFQYTFGKGIALHTWIDWDRFIWRNANEEERFLFCARIHSPHSSHHSGFNYDAFVLARHHGGQIDTTHNPVVTSTNVGTVLSYGYHLGESKKHAVGLQTSAYYSHDGALHSPLTHRNGWAIEPQIWLRLWGLVFSTAYFRAQDFITLRGEELYRSYSNWSNGLVHPLREIVRAELLYKQYVGYNIWFDAGANGYYDLQAQRIDYDFYIRLRIDWEKITTMHF